jgi:hypothetical protein
MQMKQSHTVQLDVNISAGGGEEREAVLPPGTWRLVRADFMPATTAATHATNYATITIKKGAGGTSLGTTNTSSGSGAALTKGTVTAITVTGTGADLEFTGGTTCLEVAVTQAASGAVVDGAFALTFDRVR